MLLISVYTLYNGLCYNSKVFLCVRKNVRESPRKGGGVRMSVIITKKIIANWGGLEDFSLGGGVGEIGGGGKFGGGLDPPCILWIKYSNKFPKL